MGNISRRPSESEEATRDMTFPSSCPLPLPRSSDFKTLTMLVLLIQRLVSKGHEMTLKVRETLEQLRHKNAAL